MDLETALKYAQVAHKIHQIHKAHHQLEIAVSQQSDELGVNLQIDLQATIPRGALIVGHIEGIWLGKLSAADDSLFRDDDGDFQTIGPIREQRGCLYVPYGAALNRGAGLYKLEMRVLLLDERTATSTELAQATYKLALPPQRPWHKVEFFRPLLQLCMAVIRVDNEVLSGEIRGLREMLTSSLTLTREDMAQLRAVMKDPAHGDLGQMLASMRLRMPMLGSTDIIDTLCQIARLDGPINPHELSVIHQVARLLDLPRREYAGLLTAPTAMLGAGS